MTINQLDATYNIKHVCIEENPKVIVSQFLGVIEDGFQNHSITTEVYVGERPSHCEFNLTYTALQSWDWLSIFRMQNLGYSRIIRELHTRNTT